MNGRGANPLWSCGPHPTTVWLALLCPITYPANGFSFEMRLPERWPVTGVVGADQVKSLDWRTRNAFKIGAVPEEFVAEVLGRLQTLLGEQGETGPFGTHFNWN